MKERIFKLIILALLSLTFTLTIIIYSLSITMMNDTVTSASIALTQFEYDGVSLHGIFTGSIVFGAFHLVLYIIVFIVNLSLTCINFSTFVLLGLGILNLVFSVIGESLLYKYASCFNFPSNDMLVARSSLVIVQMSILLCLPILNAILLKCCSHDDIYFSKRNISFELWLTLSFGILLILPSIVILSLNVALLSQHKPELGYTIRPSTIKLGFFSANESQSIQNGAYVKTNTFNEQIIGNLGDVIFNSNKVLAYVECSIGPDGKKSCTYYYYHTYLHEINCTNQSVLFYKDCMSSTASSLTIAVKYLDAGPYPTYNCFVNTNLNKKSSNQCSHLLSNTTLILIQEFRNKIEAAWTCLSTCRIKPRINLETDSKINPCYSFSDRLSPRILVILLVFGFYSFT
jgi:hypothetical protein